jgi:prepilin-type N-terminal cleavage/methylation domain-containing protein
MVEGLVIRGGDQRGTSLVEVLAALFLISIALLAASPMFILSTKQDAAGADMGRIGARATARLELLRTTPFYDLAPGGSLASDVTDYFDASDPDVAVRWEIIDGGGPTGTKTIAVRAVAARQVIGHPSSIELRTLRVR